MKKGTCPKCNSKEVYNSLKTIAGVNNSNTIPITGLSYAKLNNYVCINCGYVESYIAKEKDLEKIKQKWPHIDKYSSSGY